MAIKGNNSSGSSNNGGNRGRPYGVMLLIAFGAALLGVLVVHKLRERRIFNILVTEKEQQLYSLHLILQKEREESNEMRKKTEDMKAKLEKLRTQKMELDRKVLEMQSTIDSLKDEGKALETAVEEKQNEIKSLKENDATHDGQKEKNDVRVAFLEESVKQKEAKIQELKRRLEDPVKVWSVGSDDPSNSVNSNGTKVEIGGQNGNSTNGDGVTDKLPEGESGRGTDRRRLSRDEQLLAEEVKNITNTYSDAGNVNSMNNVSKHIINSASAHNDSVENIGEVESTGKRKNVHSSRRARGKKWRTLARKRWLGNNMSHENGAAIDGAESASQLRNSVVHKLESDQARSGSEGTGFESEKGVEDADLMYQEAESDSDPLRSRNT